MYDEPSAIRFEATLTSRQSQASGTDKFSSSKQKRATHAAAAASQVKSIPSGKNPPRAVPCAPPVWTGW